jgi:putative chitinase
VTEMLDEKRLFDAVRVIKGRGLTPADVALMRGVLDGTPARTGLSDPAAFFREARDVLGPLSQPEVDGCNAILTACGEAAYPLADTAYALATAYHETAGTMQPIHEYGGPAYFTRMYDIAGARPAKARELGNLQPGDGVRYAGRGYVQLTGRFNYAKAARALGVPLESDPDLAMRPDVAAAVMVRGMREGWFCGRDLDDDLPRSGPATRAQFVRSRDIINGTDKAEKIAGEAVEFQEALIAGGWA